MGDVSGKPQLRMRQTLSQFIMQHQPPHSKGDFTLLMMALQTACKVVEKNIRRAGMSGMFGYAGTGQNSTGDDQAKLDVIANDAFKALLIGSEKVVIMGSEEEDTAVLVHKEKRGGYIICFDPLDGSSNIDCNVSVGSIWGIWKLPPTQEINTLEEATRALLRSGNELVAAGYAMYASATNLVMSTGTTVDGFTLDSTIGEFVLTHPNIRIKPRKEIYSVNEGNARYWHDWFANYIDHIKFKAKKPYSGRYIGSMVADVHRTLMYGGVFCYPNDKKNTNGKLRFLYEAAPIAYLVEHAGGLALTDKGRILDVTPTKLHQRVPVFLGSKEEIDLLMSFKNSTRKSSPPSASTTEGVNGSSAPMSKL